VADVHEEAKRGRNPRSPREGVSDTGDRLKGSWDNMDMPEIFGVWKCIARSLDG
jgi:hypothetical protein